MTSADIIDFGSSGSSRFQITCGVTGIQFVIDTGASHSIISRRLTRGTTLSNFYVIAANGATIKTYGTIHKQISLDGFTYGWRFLIADTVQSVIGADFLQNFDLLVDMRRRRLVDASFVSPHSLANAGTMMKTGKRVEHNNEDLLDIATIRTKFPEFPFKNMGIQDIIDPTEGTKFSTITDETSDEMRRMIAIKLPNMAEEIARTQEADPSLEEISDTHDAIKRLKLVPGGPLLYCNLQALQPRPLIPLQLRERIFQVLHSPAHPGVKTTCKLLEDLYWWPNMAKDVTKMVQGCEKCQIRDTLRHMRALLARFPPTDAGDTPHNDIIRPLPESKATSNTEGFSARLPSDITTPSTPKSIEHKSKLQQDLGEVGQSFMPRSVRCTTHQQNNEPDSIPTPRPVLAELPRLQQITDNTNPTSHHQESQKTTSGNISASSRRRLRRRANRHRYNSVNSAP